MSAWALNAVAIALMAGVTGLTRVVGFWLMSHVRITRRIRRMLEALPGSVIAATVVPIAVQGGPPVLAAIAAAILVMMVRRNELLAMAAGVAVAALARAGGF